MKERLSGGYEGRQWRGRWFSNQPNNKQTNGRLIPTPSCLAHVQLEIFRIKNILYMIVTRKQRNKQVHDIEFMEHVVAVNQIQRTRLSSSSSSLSGSSSPKFRISLSIESSPSSPSNAARRSSSGSRSCISLSGVIQPVVKSRRAFLRANFNICNASIKTGLMRLRFFVSVSALDENARSEGTAEA